MKIESAVIIWAVEIGELLNGVQSDIHWLSFREGDAPAVAIRCAMARAKLRKAMRAFEMIESYARDEKEQEKGVVRDLPRKLG